MLSLRRFLLKRKRGREARSAPAARPGGNRQAGRPRMRSAAPRTAMPLIPGPALRRYEGGLPPEHLKRLRADLSRQWASDRNRIPGTNPQGAEPARGPPRRGRTGPRLPGTRLAAAPIPVVGKDPGPRDVTPATRTPHQPFGARALRPSFLEPAPPPIPTVTGRDPRQRCRPATRHLRKHPLPSGTYDREHKANIKSSRGECSTGVVAALRETASSLPSR